MARWQIDEVEAFKFRDFGKHGIACMGELHHL